MGFQASMLVVELDALDVVKILNREVVDLFEICFVINDILVFAQRFERVIFSFCNCVGNSQLRIVLFGLQSS